MEISDIVLEMELGGVNPDDIASIIGACRQRGFHSEVLDDELQKRGYDRIFTVDYDGYDDYPEWADEDEFASVEKFPSRRSFQ